MALRMTLYRFHNENGTSKDWACAKDSSGSFWVAFGKTGRKLQLREIGRQSPFEIDKRIKDQLGQGYAYVGTVDIDSNRFPSPPDSNQQAQPVPDAVPEDEPILYWQTPSMFATNAAALKSALVKVQPAEAEDQVAVLEVSGERLPILKRGKGARAIITKTTPKLLGVALCWFAKEVGGKISNPSDAVLFPDSLKSISAMLDAKPEEIEDLCADLGLSPKQFKWSSLSGGLGF